VYSYISCAGKFQMQVLPQCGHAVHEDVPDKVAEVLATFMIRHKFAEPESNFERFVLSSHLLCAYSYLSTHFVCEQVCNTNLYKHLTQLQCILSTY
jgi:hypothetical protein